MRAVSVQVGDSGGVLALVKPGSRVDVQAVHTRNHDDAELRTVAEDLEVLASSAPGEQAKLPVVTLLATPAEASLLGLADAAMRLRVTLRNPEDHDKRTPPGAGISSVLQRTGR
jgi:Flp pilus assembly protein CpaB